MKLPASGGTEHDPGPRHPHAPFPVPPARELLALAEIARTRVEAATARLLVGAFLLTLALVPAAQLLFRWQSLRDFLLARTTAWTGAWAGGALELNQRLRRELTALEHLLERESALSLHLRAPTQLVMLGLGNGNRAVVPGPDGWLHQADDLRYATGRGFRVRATLAARRLAAAAAAEPSEPDPVPALLRLGEDLAARGIGLVVMPVPSKAQVAPATLVRLRQDRTASSQNPSFTDWTSALTRAGITVFDPLPVLLELAGRSGQVPYLRGDSHWSPAGVASVARALAASIEAGAALPPRSQSAWTVREREVVGAGDLQQQLHLPAWPELLLPESVPLAVVMAADGRPWRPEPGAPVLLLGDSFTNMYSTASRGFGTHAGLAEQLSLALERPVDRIAIDGSPLATRQQLLRDADSRLRHTRVVVFEFASRELSHGDWQILPLPSPPARPLEPPPAFMASAGHATRVAARVAALAAIPDPGRTPYPDALIAVRLSEVRAIDGSAPGDLLVYLWGLRDRRPARAAAWHTGDTVRLEIRPWAELESELGSLPRVELLDPRSLALPAYWGEPW